MSVRSLALCALVLFATPADAGKPFDIHGLIVGNEGARYVKGVPTLDLQQKYGAVQLRSIGFYKNRPAYLIAFYNAGPEPVNIGLEDIHVTVNGEPLRVFPVEEMERQAKNDAGWNSFLLALGGALSSASAASQRDIYRSRISGPYGSYIVSASGPSLAGQLRAAQIESDTVQSIAAVQYQLDRTLELFNDKMIQRTTVDPQASYGGMVILDKLKHGDPPFEMHIDVDWNSERYPFAYVMQKPGRAVPARYAAMLAERSKPRASNAVFAKSSPEGGGPQNGPAPAKLADGSIRLPSGAVKIPAKTSSGYCLKASRDYVGTGDENYPAITGAMPRCLDDSGRVAAKNDNPFKRY
ncbi:hypothetical protein [Sphingomonas segetis]|uniref:hypothetical protein n=1 Tax=Sphingomonas segetis TaxID=1104779 RepID=UPI0012D2D53C|nr:hypothetical protein [Sphingomonas segetis]